MSKWTLLGLLLLPLGVIAGRIDLSASYPVRDCPCDDPSLCQAVMMKHEKEVFGFTASAHWTRMRWDVMTTIAWSTDADLMCTAHKNNVRLIAAAPHLNLTLIGTNQSAFDRYVQTTVAAVKNSFIDGVTFDYEEPIAPGAPEAGYYVEIINATREALHREVPGSQVSVCVAWSPNGVDGRYYDIKGFSAAADLLYIMMYDTRSQVFEQCIAAPNCALPLVEHGVQQYLALDIPREKLILGLPWYGYDYPCLPGTPSDAEFCQIPLVPFRGVSCSDAAGVEVPFSQMIAQLQANATATPRMWRKDVSNPWFNYVAKDGTVHQVWYDDAESLKLKYAVATKYGLRGTGPYTYSDLSYDPSQAAETAAMWNALAAFKEA